MLGQGRRPVVGTMFHGFREAWSRVQWIKKRAKLSISSRRPFRERTRRIANGVVAVNMARRVKIETTCERSSIGKGGDCAV